MGAWLCFTPVIFAAMELAGLYANGDVNGVAAEADMEIWDEVEAEDADRGGNAELVMIAGVVPADGAGIPSALITGRGSFFPGLAAAASLI